MTIPSTVSEISYAGNGVTTAFAVPFSFDTSADLKILSTDSNGSITTLVSGFTVTGGGGSTGTVTFATAPASGVTITILDNPELTQPTDYVSGDAFPAESHERALDRSRRIDKRLFQLTKRSFRFQDGDPISDGVLGSVDNRKGKFLFFSAITGAIEYAVSLGTTIISQSIIGQLLNPQTAAESDAGVIPVDYSIPSHDADGIVRPERYGFSASASAAVNTAALQDAVDVVEQATTLKTFSGDGYGANTYTHPELHIPAGVFDINADIVLPAAIIIRSRKAVLNQTVSSEDHFSTTAPYRLDLEGLSFKGGRRALTATGGSSANTARVRFAQCEFHTANVTNYAVVIDNGTMNAYFIDCFVGDSPLWLNIYGDYCLIDNCWVNGYLRSSGLKPNSTCSVNNRARIMHVRGGSWVPESVASGSTATRWFDNGNGTSAILALEDVQFGAEGAGGLPIVYEFGNAAESNAQVHPFVSLSGVIVRGGQLADGASSRADRGVVVLQGAVPALIDIRGATYTVDGKFVSDHGFGGGGGATLADWLNTNASGANYPRFAINIEDCGEHGSTFVPDALLPFARIRRKSRGIHPGYNQLGALNELVTEYLPDWTGKQARIVSNISGQKLDPASTTYFTALTASKEANETNGSAGCVIEIDATCHGEVAGPAGFVSSAKFLVSLLASRSGNIQSVVTTVAEHNRDSGGGTSVGNVLQCQVTGASATTVAIQLRINTTITASSATVTWTARLISNTSTVGSPGRAFSLVST